MDTIDKAKEIVNKVRRFVPKKNLKEVAILIIKNEYRSNRELLFNLRSCGMVSTDAVYLFRLQGLIDEENSIIKDINNLK